MVLTAFDRMAKLYPSFGNPIANRLSHWHHRQHWCWFPVSQRYWEADLEEWVLIIRLLDWAHLQYQMKTLLFWDHIVWRESPINDPVLSLFAMPDNHPLVWYFHSWWVYHWKFQFFLLQKVWNQIAKQWNIPVEGDSCDTDPSHILRDIVFWVKKYRKEAMGKWKWSLVKWAHLVHLLWVDPSSSKREHKRVEDRYAQIRLHAPPPPCLQSADTKPKGRSEMKRLGIAC